MDSRPRGKFLFTVNAAPPMDTARAPMIDTAIVEAVGVAVRCAGSVAAGSVAEIGDTVRFAMVDGTTDVTVSHAGVPPQLFQEGIDVVVEGAWDGEVLRSDTMLVKHDDSYHPSDAATGEAMG